jgi:hypothetical protein
MHLKRRYGRSIVPNRSELEATEAIRQNSRKSRKTPPLARRAEPLGTMALHCKTPPRARRTEPLGFRGFGVGTYESRGSFFEQVLLAAG